MSPLGWLVVIILIIVLLGGVGPHYYTGMPWRTGYGYSYGGVGVIGVILIIFVILALFGHIPF
jgi:hypothetical protein